MIVSDEDKQKSFIHIALKQQWSLLEKGDSTDTLLSKKHLSAVSWEGNNRQASARIHLDSLEITYCKEPNPSYFQSDSAETYGKTIEKYVGRERIPARVH